MGFPQQVKTVNGTTVDFHYSLLAAEGGQPAWPVVEKCSVVANSAEAESGDFALLAPPQPATPEPPPPVAPSLPLAQPPGAIGVQIESPPAITSAAEHPVTPQMEPLASVPSVVETTESIVTTIVGPNRTAPAAIAKRQGASPVVFAGLVGIAILACLAFIYFQRNH